MQRDLDPRRNAVGDERRHADAEVHIIAVTQIPGDAADDAIAPIH
jgi:hypothetical protein